MKVKTPPTDSKRAEYLTHSEQFDLARPIVSDTEMYNTAETLPFGDILSNFPLLPKYLTLRIRQCECV